MVKIININSPSANFSVILGKAEKGDSISEYLIAECYRNSEGHARCTITDSRRTNRINTIRNFTKAIKWYIKAGKHDNSDDLTIAKASYYKLGCIYSWLYSESYKERYLELSYKYFKKAADLNLPIAFCRLAEFYEDCGCDEIVAEYYNRASDEAYFKYGIKQQELLGKSYGRRFNSKKSSNNRIRS